MIICYEGTLGSGMTFNDEHWKRAHNRYIKRLRISEAIFRKKRKGEIVFCNVRKRWVKNDNLL